MNELPWPSEKNDENNMSPSLSRQLDDWSARTDIQPEDLTDFLARARAAGVSLEHDPRIQGLFSRFLDEFEQRKDQYSKNTWEQLQYGWRKFRTWCDENNYCPLPARPQIVEHFVLIMAKNMHRNSLGVLLWAIRTVHVKAGCSDPTASTRVRDRMKAVRRTKVESGEGIKQATPLRQADLNVLARTWGRESSVRAGRNWVVINLAYETMLRKSELARIKIQDIELMDDGSGVLTIPWTKSNSSGTPDTVPLTGFVVGLIDSYLSNNGLHWRSEGYLIRALTRHNRLRKRATNPVSTQVLDLIFREAWEMVLPRRPALQGKAVFSGHSCRVGAAQDLLAAGYSIPGIMQSGRWSSEVMVLRYCRHILAQEGAMFRMRERMFRD